MGVVAGCQGAPGEAASPQEYRAESYLSGMLTRLSGSDPAALSSSSV